MTSRGERQGQIYELRETVGHIPTESEIKENLKTLLSPYRQQLRDAVTVDKAEFVSQLKDARQIAVEHTGREPSRLALCATVMENSVQMPIEELSFNFYEKSNDAEYIFWSDIAHGINMVTAPLALGEEYVREHAEGIIQQAIQEREEYAGGEFPIDEAAQAYLLMQTEALEAARLLMDDPSGFALSDAAVEQVKQPPQPGKIGRIFPPNRIPEYVIAGAELGQLFYKLTHPLTDFLLDSNRE